MIGYVEKQVHQKGEYCELEESAVNGGIFNLS